MTYCELLGKWLDMEEANEGIDEEKDSSLVSRVSALEEQIAKLIETNSQTTRDQSSEERPKRERHTEREKRTVDEKGGAQREEIVQLIQSLHNEGLSFRKIAEKLNEQGTPTLSGSGLWQSGTVCKILKKA
jgi:hypothetical protein